MEYEYTYDMDWTDGESGTHTVDLELDLLLTDILEYSDNIPLSLYLQEEEIRRTMFTLIAEKVIPSIIQDVGVDVDMNDFPADDIQVDNHCKIHNKGEVATPNQPGRSLRVSSVMNIVSTLTTSHPITAIRALHIGRGGLASIITNSVMKLLKQVILKVQDRSSDDTWSLSDDDVISYKRRGTEPSSGDN